MQDGSSLLVEEAIGLADDLAEELFGLFVVEALDGLVNLCFAHKQLRK